MKINDKGMLLKSEKEGYLYISKNGLMYSLLEGFSYGGNSTNDVVIIMLDPRTSKEYDKYADTLAALAHEQAGVGGIIQYYYGANHSIGNNTVDVCEGEDVLNDVEYYVRVWENNHSALVDSIKPLFANTVEELLTYCSGENTCYNFDYETILYR